MVSFNKNVLLTRFKKNISYDDWLRKRNKISGQKDFYRRIRLGGSDVGVIMDLSDYKTPGGLYYELIGLKATRDIFNEHTYRGQTFETTIEEKYWRYFDPRDDTLEAFLINARGRIQVRESQRVHAIIRNKKYRQLFSNIDFIVPATGELKGDGILEIKSMYRTALEKWEAGIPPSHIVQVQSYMTVTEKPYGEVFILADATIPYHFPFSSNKDIEDNILSAVHNFCYRVNKVRKEMIKLDNPDHVWQLAHDYEPESRKRALYIDFLKEMYRPENIKIKLDGSKEFLGKVIEYSNNRIEMSRLDELAMRIEIDIRREFLDHNTDEINFAFLDPNEKKYPTISWKKKLNIAYKKFATINN